MVGSGSLLPLKSHTGFARGPGWVGYSVARVTGEEHWPREIFHFYRKWEKDCSLPLRCYLFSQDCLSLPTPSPVQRFQEAGQQCLWHRVTQGFLLTLLGRLFCSRSCPQTSGCLSVKPGHRGCPCWQQGPAHLAARSHPTPCRIRLVGYIFHPVTGLWQGQAAPRQGSQRWSVPAWQPQAGPGCGCEPRVPGMGALKRRWHHVQRVIVKVETCVQQAVGLCPRPPRHSGLPT